MQVTENQYECLQTSDDKEKAFQDILNEALSNLQREEGSEANRESNEKYIASML